MAMLTATPDSMTDPNPKIELPACDTSRKFVRVLADRADGFVAFEFSIGWPELAVELLLPAPAFAEFCAANGVLRLD
jgi:phenol/toluene 2-monooxygenase (NADH) P0/A0